MNETMTEQAWMVEIDRLCVTWLGLPSDGCEDYDWAQMYRDGHTSLAAFEMYLEFVGLTGDD